MTKTIAILDADLILHRSASAVQANYEWANGATSVSADFPKAREKALDFILEWSRAVEADKVVMALSDPTGNYFRRQILPTYKSHRKGKPKPVLFYNLRDWLNDEYETVWKPGLEGDDVMGLLATTPSKYPGARKVIASPDKDMLTVPGLLYRPHRRAEGVQTVTREAADRAHLVQTLAGDSTDGFAGIPGIGQKKAEKILDGPPKSHTTHHEWCWCSPWGKVVHAYQRAGLTESDALVQARVARILRFGDYHQDVGVRAWEPGVE